MPDNERQQQGTRSILCLAHHNISVRTSTYSTTQRCQFSSDLAVWLGLTPSLRIVGWIRICGTWKCSDVGPIVTNITPETSKKKCLSQGWVHGDIRLMRFRDAKNAYFFVTLKRINANVPCFIP